MVALRRGGASFYFHHEGIGSVPVVILGITKSPRFNVLIGTPATFQIAVTLFDEFDEWFAQTANSKAWLYAASCLNLPFDPTLLQEFDRMPVGGLEQWIEGRHEAQSIYQNVDY
jgi:hypothetical protein